MNAEHSQARMIVVRGLIEPFVPTKATTEAEDRAVNAAAESFRKLGASGVESAHMVEPLQRFADAHPHSGWTPAVLTDLGMVYYQSGFFSRAFDSWEKAWREGRNTTDPMARRLVDRAVGELARMHARVGHAEELRDLFADIGTRS